MPTITPSPSSIQPPPLSSTQPNLSALTQTNRPKNSICRRKFDREANGREVARLLHLRHRLLKEARERGHGVVDGGVETEGTVAGNSQERIGREKEGLVKEGDGEVEAVSPWTIGKVGVEELLGMVGSETSSRGNCVVGAGSSGPSAGEADVTGSEGSGCTVVHVSKKEGKTRAEKERGESIGKVESMGGEDPYLELMQHAVLRGEQRRGERPPTRRYHQRDGSVRLSFEGHLSEGRVRG